MPYEALMADKGVLDTLLTSIKNDAVAHAYLFEGEEGLQKRQSAAYFASAMLCESKEDVPCGQCENCIQAFSKNNPDIKRMSLSDITSKKSIGADEIRSIISDVYTRPFKSSKKIYIIEEGDALTVQAQNAMLKVLEEPPEYAVFIICVSNAELILPTVRSRSRIVRFMPSSDAQIAEYVKRKYPHMASRADFVASVSGGVLGRADFICSNEAVMQMREEAFDFIKKLMRARDEEDVFMVCERFEEYKKEKSDIQDTSQLLLDFMLSFLGDMLHILSGAENVCANKDKKSELGELCAKTSIRRIHKAMDSVLETKQMLSRYVSHKAAIMKMALDMFYID